MIIHSFLGIRHAGAKPYRDGTTHVAFEGAAIRPVDFIARLAALVPKPRVNLTRYHGVLACAARPQPPVA